MLECKRSLFEPFDVAILMMFEGCSDKALMSTKSGEKVVTTDRI